LQQLRRTMNHQISEACIDVLMPAFNEEATIDIILQRVLAQSCVARVIVVDDGSTDSTWSRLCRWVDVPRVKLIQHEQNRGKGAAIRTALQHTDAPYVVVQDADLEYDPSEFHQLVAALRETSCEVVYGSRFA